jgi:hypothetical protein
MSLPFIPSERLAASEIGELSVAMLDQASSCSQYGIVQPDEEEEKLALLILLHVACATGRQPAQERRQVNHVRGGGGVVFCDQVFCAESVTMLTPSFSTVKQPKLRFCMIGFGNITLQ